MFEFAVNMTAEMLMDDLHISEQMARYLAEDVALPALFAGLQMTYELTKPYTPDRFDDEIHGLADGSGLPQKLILWVNMLPEFFKASCTMMGAWGASIPQGNELFQLRALDWVVNGPFNDYPLLTVYHPDPVQVPGAVPFSTYGYPGFVGTLTGYSSTPIGLSEKLAGFPNGTHRAGYPWHYLMRDILEFDKDIEEGYYRMYNANRTCDIWIGIGDTTMREFRMVAYGYHYLVMYDDTNCPTDANRPRFPGVVYNDPHPGSPCLGNLVNASYGSIDAQQIIQMTAADDTGYTHVAVYDYLRNYVYLAHASSVESPPVIIASLRPYVRVDMNQLWLEQLPNHF